MKKSAPFTLLISLLAVGAFSPLFLSNQKPYSRGEHPGYFEQWLEEKKSADGTWPEYIRSQWAQADRRLSVRNRSGFFDTVLELGPRDIGGRTRSLWVDPNNSQIILAAAISGGMWRSEDAGSSWKPLNDHEVNLMASCITYNPFNPSEIYYGTGESRANSADVDGDGVFKSTDGGQSFQQLSSTVSTAGFSDIWDIAHSYTDSQTLFVGSHTKGLFRSTDGGNSWEVAFSGGNKQVNNVICMPSGRVILSMQANQVYYSDDNGAPGTFVLAQFANAPVAGTYRRIQMGYCAQFPNVAYAVFEGFGFSDPPAAFYKSSDGGATWTPQRTPTDMGAGYQAYCVMLGVHPTDSNSVVVGGVGITETRDGGQTWIKKQTGHSDHHSYAALPNGQYLIGTDGGVYRYKWGNSQVQANLNAGYQVTQFYAGGMGYSGYTAIAGAQDNGTHVSTGRLVSSKFYGADGAYCAIGQQDGSVAYLSTQNEGIRRVPNFNPKVAPSWQQTVGINDSRFASDGVDFINLYEVSDYDQGQLYYRTNRYLYQSTDMGTSWNPISKIRTGIKAIAISYEQNPVVYFGGTAAQLYRIDSALSAASGSEVSLNNSIPSSVTNDVIKGIWLYPHDPNTCYIAFSNYSTQPRIWRGTNLNTNPTWVEVSSGLPSGLPVNMVCADPNDPENRIFAATDYGFYYTLDGGKTWEKNYDIPSVAVHQIKIRASDRTLFLFTHGRGMWAIQRKPEVNRSANLEARLSLKLFPNPATQAIQVEFPLNMEYRIYNHQGQCLKRGQAAAGLQRISMEGLPAGNYFIQGQSIHGTYTQSFVKQP
ncbi:MAG: T9SS type A sorting domain-containing protein [Bacteroidia bacterium]